MKEEKIEVLNNQRAVNLSIFQPDGEKIGNFEKEGGQVLKLGLIGKPSREKGLYYFIEIIKRISELDGNVVGYITCSAYNENREQIRQIARNLKINDKIKLMNFQYPWNMPKLYRTLDIVICPEMGFGIDIHNTVIPREAMACGTLTAISEEIYRKFPYHLEESGNAFLTFNEERIHDLIREIILIRNDSDRKSTIIQNGLKFSKTIEKYKTGIQEFYLLLRELLQGG
ncbi:MAG: glycosyltransferase [Candidatus Helarchaeota archaeon]